MSVAKVRACSTPDAMTTEQKTGKPEKGGNESLDNIIRQAIGKEPFFSFSRAGDSPIQWIQLLHALDEQGSSKVPKGPTINNAVEGKEHSLDYSNGLSSLVPEMNGVKESIYSVKGSGVPAKVTNSGSEHAQTLKIPEAVVAFAQAAAKANGEPEKYLPGWPLLSPSKVQLQKCDKCSREFCSPINYRRHVRVHRRSLNVDKVSPKTREFLGAFWDKLSLDEAKELASFKNVTLEEVAGSSIIRALTSLIRRPGFPSLPQAYVKAGIALLDVLQARPSKFPISSQELFSILDDASEKTFLCAGTAISLQKFVFDGEVGKIAMEMKNLVACTSFLLEQKLVKSWLADKDAEALRCQKLLVEEEEAAQKRQADLLERRRLKKRRQKEQKVKEHIGVSRADDFKDGSLDSIDGASSSAEALSPRTLSETVLNTVEASVDSSQPFLESIQSLDPDSEADLRCHIGFEDANQNEHRIQQGSGRRPPNVSRWPVAKPARNALKGYHLGQAPVTKAVVVQKYSSYRDPKANLLTNGQKVWTRKTKPEREEEVSNGRNRKEIETSDRSDIVDNCEVLIGSINVTLGDCNNCRQDIISPKQNNAQEKMSKPDSSLNSVNQPTVKLWRPVDRHESGECPLVQNNKKETKLDGFPNEYRNQILTDQSCLSCGEVAYSSSERSKYSKTLLGNADQSVHTLFSSRVAEVFLAQRWKEALACDHMTVLPSPETYRLDTHEGDCTEALQPSSDYAGRIIVGNTENRLAKMGSIETVVAGVHKPEFRAKLEKSYRLKYMPKEINNI